MELLKGNSLIKLTKLDKTSILINLETIKYIEAIPDTLILFLNGDSLIVSEPIDEVIEKTIALKAQICSAIANSKQKQPEHRV